MIFLQVDLLAAGARSAALHQLAGQVLMAIADVGPYLTGPPECSPMANPTLAGGMKAAAAWLPGWFLGAWTAAGHLLIFASMPDVGTIMAAITGLCVGLLGLYVTAMKTITSSRIDAAKAWEEAQRTSLSAQIAGLKDQMESATAEHKEQLSRLEAKAESDAAEARESIAHARASLHDIRNEANLEQLRLKANILELTEELHATRKDLGSTRADYQRLVEVTNATNRTAKRVEKQLDRIDLAGSSEHDMPTAPEG